jgi:hypothetical protein
VQQRIGFLDQLLRLHGHELQAIDEILPVQPEPKQRTVEDHGVRTFGSIFHAVKELSGGRRAPLPIDRGQHYRELYFPIGRNHRPFLRPGKR